LRAAEHGDLHRDEPVRGRLCLVREGAERAPGAVQVAPPPLSPLRELLEAKAEEEAHRHGCKPRLYALGLGEHPRRFVSEAGRGERVALQHCGVRRDDDVLEAAWEDSPHLLWT